MRKTFDLRLYFIADPECCAGRDIVEVVRAAVRGGVTMVQYRDKKNPKDIIIHNAVRLKEVIFTAPSPHGGEGWGEGAGIPLIINDYIDIARECGADGVHLGQGDADPAKAREILGPEAIIGLTAFTPAHMRDIDPDVIDYVGTGPVFPTKTDKGKPVLGLEKFRNLCELSPVPVVGIGGITADKAPDVLKAGARGAAIMRAIGCANDVKQAATQCILNLKNLYDEY